MTNKSFAVREFNVERRSIPLAIQTYFWRQTSQLLKTNLVKRQYESACVALERVICENRIQDLQPSLASAVKSVPRWYFVHSAVPYVIQCCAALLSNRHRLGYFDRLANPERELIYTLQWILFEAPEICGIEDPENLLHPITTIELFVHLLIPHVFKIHENDLTFRLERGQDLWKPLWDHKMPLIPAFTHPVICKDPNNPDDLSLEVSIDIDFPIRNSRGSLLSARKSGISDALPFSSAAFFDVAVLRCLSSSGWVEEGVYWGLLYIADYLKREFNLPDTKKNTTTGPKFFIGTTASAVLGDNSAGSFGSENIQSPQITNTAVTPQYDVQIQVIHEDEKDAKSVKPDQVPESTVENGVDVITEEKVEIKLVVPGEDRRGSLTRLRIRVDSPILPHRGPMFAAVSIDKEESSDSSTEQCATSQTFYGISVTPSTPTVEIVNELEPSVTSMNGLKGEPSVVSNANHNGISASNTYVANYDIEKGLSNNGMVNSRDGNSKDNGGSNVGCIFQGKSYMDSSHEASTNGYTRMENSSGGSNTAINDFTGYNSTGSNSEPSIGSASSLGGPSEAVSPSSGGSDVDKLTFSFSSVSQLGSEHLIEGTCSSEELTKEGDNDQVSLPQDPCPTKSRTHIEPQSSLSSDEPSLDAKQSDQKDDITQSTGSASTMEASKPDDIKVETSSSEVPVSDADMRSLLRDSSTETQDTAEAPCTQPGRNFNIRRSTNSNRGSMFNRTEHFLVFPGTGDYITSDGRLSILVILQAVNGVLKENLSARVCGASVKVLEVIATIQEKERSRKRASTVSVAAMDDRTVAETMAVGWRTHQSETVLGRLRSSLYGRAPTIRSLATGSGLRLIQSLGCPLGCGEGCHAYRGDLLREQANSFLANIQKQDDVVFKSWLHNYARMEPVEEIVDFLHAFLGFCDECNEFSGDDGEDEGKKTKGKLFAVKEGVEAVVLDVILKPLITRVAEMKLTELANLTFYGELRQLLRYVKDNYGGVFWRVAMSGLMESAYRGKKETTEAGNVDAGKPSYSTATKGSIRAIKKDKGDKITPKVARRKFFKVQKFSRNQDGSDNDLMKTVNSTSFNSTKVTADGTAVEDTLSPRSKRKIFQIGTWRKQKTIGQNYDSDDDTLDSPDTPTELSIQPMSLKRKLFKEKSRKRIEEGFSSKSSCKKMYNSSSSSLLESPTIDIVVQEYERKPVDVSALREGLIRLRYLMNGSQPGGVPDPQIVAAMLDLEAPVVARAALLLECAQLVHRCNRGEWPTWLRGSHPSLSQRRGHAPKTISLSTPRRNLVAMHEAGVLFHSWGVAIGQKLEHVLKKRRTTLPSIQEEERKSLMKLDLLEEEMEEDFLNEGTLSESSQSCPYALKMIACQLLIEITAFLRESHGMYQIRRDSRGMQGRGVRGRKSLSGEKRRSTHFGSDQPHNRFSAGYFGGGGERIRKQSAISQSSVPSDFSTTISTSPGRSGSPHEPPVIMVLDQEGRAADDTMLLKRRASDSSGRFRKLSDCGTGDPLLSPKRSSLYLPKTSVGSSSPRLGSNRSARLSCAGGEAAESARQRKRCGGRGKRPSGPVEGFHEDEDESDEEETSRFPWLHSVILLNSSTSYLCDHQTRCPSNCHQRQKRICARLIKALQNVYSGQSQRPEKEKTHKLEKSKSRTAFNLGSVHITSPMHGTTRGDWKSSTDKLDKPMLEYVKTKLCGLTHCAFSLIAKAGTVIDGELLEETLPVAWELLLDDDQQLVSAAASVFLLSGIRLKNTVEEMLYKELTCSDPDDRVKSLLRYEVLWKSRYHAWPRLEEGACFVLKVPPPRVDFTLPSPLMGLPAQHAPDCPWDPYLMLEEQPGNRKAKNKGKKKVKEAEEAEAKRKLREQFPLRTVPVSLEATMGAADEEKSGHSRWVHLNWELCIQPRMKEESSVDGETHQVNAEMWPAAFSSAIPYIIRLLDDVLVDSNETAVMEGAYRLIWNCLVEDPVLFFRTILEELTKKDKQEEHIVLIKKLFMYMDQLPPASARFLLNNLIGVAMYYARTNKPGAQDSVALVLSLTWELVPSVRGLFLKDIKQCLKKEHCDAAMLIFANVPGVKKLAVACCGADMSERIPVNDEMTFDKVIGYLRTRFELEDPDLWLIDIKSNQLLEKRDYVRDVFPHRKGFPSPQLKLEHVDPERAFLKRQAQAFTSKLADTGRILLSLSVLKALPNEKHSFFLHGEFSRQTSFPRKALECDFALYGGSTKGKELYGMDVIHKIYWVKLVASLFQFLPSDFPWGNADLNLFLNVINGAILLHCEDAAMIRLCIGSLINIAIHFSHIFASDGFQFVFPSLLQVYAHHQGNDMVTQAIEFALSQFYTLHQKPSLLQFLLHVALKEVSCAATTILLILGKLLHTFYTNLQLFASVAPILQLETRLEDSSELEPEDPSALVHPKCLFTLLASLDNTIPDALEILELVDAEKPLKAMDSCYVDELDLSGESTSVDVAIRLCVTVVDFAPESKRATQMVIVLSAILPYYLESLAKESETGDLEAVKKEAIAITSLCTSINVLIKSSDILTRSFVHFQSYKSLTDRSHVPHSSWGSATSLNMSRGSISSFDMTQGDEGGDEDGRHGRPLLERLRAQEEKNEVMDALEQYRKPRNALLVLVADYVSICTRRVEEIRKILPARQVIPDLLDEIAIILLAEIMYSLMKLAVYDPITMGCPGVQRYILQALPLIDWSQEAVEPAVNLVLKRLSKIFNKLIHKPDLVRNIEWKALESYVRGIYLVLCRQKFIAKSQYLKTLVTTCMSFVLEERPSLTISLTAFLPMAPICAPPQFFCDTIIKLASRLMYSLNNDYTLRELCGGSTNFGSPVRTEKVFVRVLLPICIRLGSGRPDAPKASPDDVEFALKCFLRVITTKNSATPGSPPIRLSLMDDDVDGSRALSFVDPYLGGTCTDSITESLYQAAYLGLKLLLVCFEDQLAMEWYKIFKAIDKVVDNHICGVAFWDFLDFNISHRTPLYLMLVPLVQTKAVNIPHNTRTELALKQRTLERLARPRYVVHCKNAIIQTFLDELRTIKLRRTVKDDTDKDGNTLQLNSPPHRREEDKVEGSTGDEVDENGLLRKQSKKTVTFSPYTSYDDSVLSFPKSPTDSESSNTSHDRRKKWLRQKYPSFESCVTADNQNKDDGTVCNPFSHQRGTAVKGKLASAERGPVNRKGNQFKTVATSSFSQDGEINSVKESTEEFKMAVIQTSISLPDNLDAPETLDHESTEAKRGLKPLEHPLRPDSNPAKEASESVKQDAEPVKQDSKQVRQDPEPVKNNSEMMKKEKDASQDNLEEIYLARGTELSKLNPELFIDDLKETIIDGPAMDEDTDRDIFSSGSSPVKSGLEESDEEFLDAMSEWPKEVALALAALNSPVMDSSKEWKNEKNPTYPSGSRSPNSDYDVIPMYPFSPSSAKEAKMKLDGITTYSNTSRLPQHDLQNDMGSPMSQISTPLSNDVRNNTYTHTYTFTDSVIEAPPDIRIDSLPNGPSHVKPQSRSDSSPDILESIKPTPPVEPTSGRSGKRSVPSYVIKISSPLDDGPEKGRSRLWHHLYTDLDPSKGTNLVPLASEEDISAELTVDFANSSFVDLSRETSV